MGSESSSMRGFTLQEPPWTHPSGLTIHPALLPEGRVASVFVYQPDSQDKVDKAAKHLKTLRHPCLLRFLSFTVEEDGIYLVTERVQPLEMLLQKLSADEICSGIYDILQALVFLHERSAEFGIVPVSLSHARDAFLFGRLVESLLAHVKEQSEVLSSFKNTVKNLLLNPEPELRLTLSSLLSHDYFRNDFLEVVNFLESLTVKTEEEKNEFFKTLLDRVSSLPEELISSRLVPLLLNQFVFAEPMAVKSFLPHLLRPKRDIMGRNREDCLLSPALFQTKVIPVLMKMFEVHEEHVRVVLLTHIDAYGELFTLKELKDIILPQVLLGLRDTSDLLVSVTLRGLAALVCLLGPETVVGGGRVKIFKSTTPGFTKITDSTPEGSPVHSANNHLSLATQSSVSTVLAKSNFPEVNPNCLIKEELHAQDILKKFRKNDFHTEMNEVPGVQLTVSPKVEPAQQSPEDWPDWSESDAFTSDSFVHVPQKTEVVCDHSDAEHWDDFSLSNDCLKTEAANISSETNGILDVKRLSSLNSVSSLDHIAASSNSHTDKLSPSVLPLTKPTQDKVSDKKLESWNSLGDEFTIKVKSKSRDPELDWFADMAPEIKISTAFISLGSLEESVTSAELNMDPAGKQSTTFSAKFAAAEIEETEAEGWGEENELGWEEDANSW
ncbi:protein-associating with the carboxyl-terminal domain of ezrin isoform X2 [Phyllobates terribilis]|uniref:protein-associating with the carboxyl-terminal domain of ezrin isoform X2 n=1 Tax=Phyllobates terribilis TaxID=111132 RepID=UPI003CCB214F